MNDIEHCPWHETQWDILTRDLARLSHALLLGGQPGLGKFAFATRLARSLLCDSSGPEARACGSCKSCLLVRAGTHPDLRLVEPAEEGKPITVDQVRALVDFATTRPHTAQRKVVIMRSAQAMNLNAANSLLKLLEEPPLGNVFVLVSDRPSRLPATVRSRCQLVDFKPPPRDAGTAWLAERGVAAGNADTLLALAGGAPLQALVLWEAGFLDQRAELFDDMEAIRRHTADPVSRAARWQGLGPELCLEWLQRLVSDLIKVAMLGDGAPGLVNADLASRLQALVEGLNLKQLYGYADAVSQARELLKSPLDGLLLLEDILIRWRRVTQ